jgi:RNA polymerase sigma-70 factor (ECF subfamily)
MPTYHITGRFFALDTRNDLESSGRDALDGPGIAYKVPKTMSTPPWSDPFEAELGRLPEKLRRFFLSRGVRTEDEALDLVQETLLRVLQRVSRADQPLDSPEAFSLGVAKNVFLEYCRRVQRANKHEGLSGVLELAGTENPLSDALASSRKLIVRKALELLPGRMRVLLVRRFVEEVPSRTIAREEGITTDAVDMRVYRAKRELRKRMDSTEARSAVRTMREEAAGTPPDEEEDR